MSFRRNWQNPSGHVATRTTSAITSLGITESLSNTCVEVPRTPEGEIDWAAIVDKRRQRDRDVEKLLTDSGPGKQRG